MAVHPRHAPDARPPGAEQLHAPGPLLLMLEARAPWEWAAMVAAAPWLRQLPRGDGHLLAVLGAGMVGLVGFVFLASMVRAHLLIQLRMLFDARMTLGFVDHLLKLPYAYLQRRSTGRTIYVLDEPTTGLHSDDIRKLLGVLGRLVDGGNTVIVIEHNLDVIKTADWVIDLGPEGGTRGGDVIATGTPEDVAQVDDSYTGQLLRGILGAEDMEPGRAA